MTVRQAGLRTLGYLLSFATCGAGFLWVLFNQRKQALHDRMNTSVKRTIGTLPDSIKSASTCPGPTDGNSSTSPTKIIAEWDATALSS